MTSVFLTDIYTTTLTISTSLVLYLYMDIWKIRWMNEWVKDQMMSTLNTACFVIWTIQAIMSPETLRMVNFACIHSIMSYGVSLRGNQQYSDKIFKIQKRVIRIIISSRMRDSCRGLLKKIRNTALIFSIYLLNINICYKKLTFILYK